MYRTRESERAHHTWLVLALDRHKGSYSDRKRALKWVLLVTVPRTVLDDAARLRTASVRQDQRKYCVLLESQLANGLRPS